MISTSEIKMDKDLKNKQIVVKVHFNAKPDAVWQAWTTKAILDKWWAPKPWRAETEKLDFKEGGSWLYAMVGPKNERHYANFLYRKIDDRKSFEGEDAFTDENGSINKSEPQTYWKCEFKAAGTGTDVKITLTPKTEGALEKNLDMGFEEGFKSGLGNLEEYFEGGK